MGQGVDDALPVPGRPAPAPSRRFLLAVLVVLLVASAYVVMPFLAATLFALLFGFLLYGPCRRLEKRVRSRKAAAGLILLGVAVSIVLPVAFITSSIIDQARGVAATIESPNALRQSVTDSLVRLGVPNETATALPDRAAGSALGFVQGLLGPTVNAVVEFLAGFVVFFFLLYYVLVDGDRIMSFLRENLPLASTHRERLLKMVGDRVRAILLGAVLVSVIQGVAAGIGWAIFGFPNPIFWGFVMTVLAVLPFMGPVVVMVPAALFALLQGDTVAGVGLLLWAVGVVGLVDNFARPYVVGRQTDVHPGIVLIGTLGGLVVFGVSGFVLGPLLVSLVPPVLEAWHDAATGETPETPTAPEDLPPPSAPEA